jgi:hypothetical protein
MVSWPTPAPPRLTADSTGLTAALSDTLYCDDFIASPRLVG